MSSTAKVGLVRSIGADHVIDYMRDELVGQKLGTFVASENAEDLVALRGLIEAGKVVPAIDRAYPRRGVPLAIRHMIDGHARGKVVITV